MCLPLQGVIVLQQGDRFGLVSASMVKLVNMWMSQFFAPVGWSRMLFVLLQISLARLVLLAMRINIHLDCTDAVTLNARNLQPGIDIQRRDRLFEELLRHADIDQRAQEHVAADAGKTIKVGYTHRR